MSYVEVTLAWFAWAITNPASVAFAVLLNLTMAVRNIYSARRSWRERDQTILLNHLLRHIIFESWRLHASRHPVWRAYIAAHMGRIKVRIAVDDEDEDEEEEIEQR